MIPMRKISTPSIGDRVVVRRFVPDQPGKVSDIIGHVLATEPLTVRPQDGTPEVIIPVELIQILKIIPPQRVRNSDIRAVETATAKAFPGIDHRWEGQWLLRAGDGITERSNSAAPLGHSAGLSEVPTQAIFEFYQRHNLPVRILIPDRIGNPARTLCQGPAWHYGPEISVMTRTLNDLPEAPEVRFRLDVQPTKDWLNLYHFRGTALPEHALNLLRTRIDGTMGFGQLIDSDGRIVAITRGTITTSDDGRIWLGYSAVEVDAAYRRRGLGTQLGIHMLHWGKQQGADHTYLQVVDTNVAGISLYKKLGFAEHHRHRYAEYRAG